MLQLHGSGKTAVLVERIINKILKENIDIDKLLIVTFTNAAAAEMKERILNAIYKKLEEEPENRNLQRQIILLNKASICTIDSFCLDIVKNNFFELENISPNFRISDASEIEIMKLEVLEEVFERKYDEHNEGFLKLINIYTSYKDDTPLKDMITKIFNFIQSNPFPEKWLNEHIEMFNLKDSIEKDFSQTPWGNILLNEVKEEIIDDLKTLRIIYNDLTIDENLEIFYQTIEQDIKMLETLEANLDNWDKIYNMYKLFSFTDWPRKRIKSDIKDEAKATRDIVKKKFKSKLDNIFICNSKQANEDIIDMYNNIKSLEKLIIEFSTEFSKRKREKNIVDFNDIEHFALKILLTVDEEGNVVQTEIAKKYQEKFEEIAIDEYQDSNMVQEYIMTAVSRGNNIFMVGDVKQSIYKFRQAMPELFLNKYSTYSDVNENNGYKIKLFKNFRSRNNVLDFTNVIFKKIMSENLGDVNYSEDEFLNFGAEDYEDSKENLKTEIDIINLQDEEIEYEENDEEDEETVQEERLENIEIEAKYTANKIRNLIDSKFKIYDRKNKEFRDINYKDIVILLRSTKDKANVFERELTNLNVPVFSDTSQEYLDSIEIETIMALLKIIDNPIQDIPLVTVLRSSIGGFSDNELIQIRLCDKQDYFYNTLQKAQISVEEKLSQKIKKFLEQLKQWRKEQEYLSLDELIWKIIYVDTNFYNDVLKMPNGIVKQENLKMLFERAKQYEKVSFKGLYNFIKFIEKIKTSSGDLGSAKLIGENDNVVRIMSIHKSKGLEFPIVFLANTGKQFNMQDIKKDAILLNQKLGIGFKYIDYEKQIQYDTLTRAAVKNEILNENISEEMRILYVALTRAKEKLYVISALNDANKDLEKLEKNVEMYEQNNNKINPILLKKYQRYIDWILLVNLYEKSKMKELIDINILNKTEILNDLKEKDYKVPQEEKCEYEKVEDNWVYEFKQATITPTKTSVTKLKQSNVIETINLAKPEFLKQEQTSLTSAQRGTIMHLCLEKLNIKEEYDFNKLKQMINSLQEKQLINETEAKSININKILNFTKSNIFKDLKEAKTICREKPFYINIKQDGEDVLIQGIIDLYYINKNDELILVDYKTDYVENGNSQELIDKYSTQLNLYKQALESALQRKVDKVYIYSVYLEQMISI